MNSYPAMAINIKTKLPTLANISGGLSGPAIKPIAVKLVWDAYKSTSLPIIGMGGIFNTDDAIEFFLAGASAIAIGTANFIDPSTAERVIDGINHYLIKNGYACINELIGQAQT